MHKSITENLPKFTFPHLFLKGLPEEYEPVIPSEEEKRKIFNAVETLDGTLPDYFFSERTQMIHHGHIRDCRRYPDGNTFARIDSYEDSCYGQPEVELQTLLLLDHNWQVIRYTNTCDEMKRQESLVVNDTGRKQVISCNEKALVINKLPKLNVDGYIHIESISDGVRSLRIYRLHNDPEHLFIGFCIFHLPWSFGLGGLTDKEAGEMAGIFIEKGLYSLIKAYNWQYWDWMKSQGTVTTMAVYPRLQHHLYLAEFHQNLKELEMLKLAKIPDDNASPIWLKRRTEASWPEVIDDLYHFAATGKPNLNNSRPVTELEKRRIIIYCALEGHEQAALDAKQMV